MLHNRHRETLKHDSEFKSKCWRASCHKEVWRTSKTCQVMRGDFWHCHSFLALLEIRQGWRASSLHYQGKNQIDFVFSSQDILLDAAALCQSCLWYSDRLLRSQTHHLFLIWKAGTFKTRTISRYLWHEMRDAVADNYRLACHSGFSSFIWLTSHIQSLQRKMAHQFFFLTN